jgi:hypothetical protein
MEAIWFGFASGDTTNIVNQTARREVKTLVCKCLRFALHLSLFYLVIGSDKDSISLVSFSHSTYNQPCC